MSTPMHRQQATEPSPPAGTPPRPRRNSYLSFSPPLIGEEEIGEVVDTLRSDWITTGPKAAQFEAEFAAAVSAPAAVAVNSCTAALHTALLASGIGAGDEVITTPLTFAATANVVEHVGARPVLVDVERDTLTINPTLIEAAITGRTRAIMPVHYAGHPADLDPIPGVSSRLAIVDATGKKLSEARGRRGERVALRNVLVPPGTAQLFLVASADFGWSADQRYDMRVSAEGFR